MILTTLAVAVFLGILAQVLAERWKLPAILPLLLFGMAAGPQALGILHPEELGEFFREFIHLGVAVILFEGGLSLHMRELRQVGRAVGHLLTVGLVVTWIAAAALAHYFVALPWSTAALFGAIVTVTGPTVIVPLLRHMIAPRPVKTVLVSEGLIIDPIGAVLAYLVLQWIERAGIPPLEILQQLFTLSATGALVGFAFGKMGDSFAKRRLVGGELRNLAILALVLLCFLASERTTHESGIVAVVVMGITMSAANIPDLEPLRAFKEQLTILLISFLFILLAGQLDLQAVVDLGWQGLAVAVGMVVLVRPLSVFLSVWPSQMDLRGRTVLAMLAPRGIVAAAVASLAARKLTDLETYSAADGAALEGLVYLVILVTGVWATTMAVTLPRRLGYLDDPSRRLVVLVGVNPVSRGLAKILHEEGRMVMMLDSARSKLEGLRQEGIEGIRGDARAASTYERAGVEGDTQVVLLTTNDELNVLAAELVRSEFGVEHPIAALQSPSPELGGARRAWLDLLGGGPVHLLAWQDKLKAGRAGFLTVDLSEDSQRETLEDLWENRREDLVVLCGWEGDQPHFDLGENGKKATASYGRVTVLVAGEARNELSPVTAGRPAPAPGSPTGTGVEPTPAGTLPEAAPIAGDTPVELPTGTGEEMESAVPGEASGDATPGDRDES